MNSPRWLRPSGAVLPFVLITLACGGAEEPSSSGDGDGGLGSGGTALGDGDGDFGSGGTPGDGDLGSGGGTGGSVVGTGGSASTGRVPGTDSYDCEPAAGTAGTLGKTQVATGFNRPIYVTHAPNDSRLFIIEQEGIIKLSDGTTFLDIRDRVLGPEDSEQEWDERGLLGLAFHPDYGANGLFYVFYSADPGSASTLAEFRVSADNPNAADASSARTVLTIPQTHENHKAGTLAFGADGYLYVSVGDGGTANTADGGDPDGQGQNATTLMGSILRIDPSGSPYTAAGNYPGGAAEVWDIGLRNPFRMSFDGCNGDLYIGDVGQEVKEEINIEKAGEGGKNYGWNTMEGTTCFNAASKTNPLGTCDHVGLTAPVLDYDTTGGAAVIGGAVYRGSEIPWLRGTYFYGDQVQAGRSMSSFVYDRDTGAVSGETNRTGELGGPTGVVSISNGSDGEIYFLTMFDGTLWKLTAL